MSVQSSRFSLVLAYGLFLGLCSSQALAVKQVTLLELSAPVSNGVLSKQNNQCYLVAPVPENVGSKFTVQASSGDTLRATFLRSLAKGVGLFRLDQPDSFFCMSLWSDEKRVSMLLDSGRQAFLDPDKRSDSPIPVSLNDGGSGFLEAVIVDQSVLPQFRPGALIRIRSAPVAMVTEESVTEDGVSFLAVRFDVLSQELKQALLESDSSRDQKAEAAVVEGFPEVRTMRLEARSKLRRAPDEAARVIKMFREGTEFEVLGKVKDRPWLAVRFYGLEGFLPESDFSR